MAFRHVGERLPNPGNTLSQRDEMRRGVDANPHDLGAKEPNLTQPQFEGTELNRRECITERGNTIIRQIAKVSAGDVR